MRFHNFTMFVSWNFLTILLMLIYLIPSSLFSQSIIPNGGFETWERRHLFYEFPPYGTTNSTVFFSSTQVQANVTPVTGCASPDAVRLENILVGGAQVQQGALVVGNIGSVITGGLPYTEQPDSIFFTLRYEIAAGDEAIIACFFTTTDSNTVSGLFETLTDSALNCTTIGFDLPAFTGMPDSLAILVSSGSFSNAPVEGSWIELDSIFFSGSVSPLPNAGFSDTEALEVLEPVDWYSANDLQLILNGPGGTPMAEQDGLNSYEGQSALKVSSRLIESDSNIIGIIINGQGLIGDAIGGQPYLGDQSDTLTGWYRYEPVGNDTALVFLRFFSYEPDGDSTIIHLETGTSLSPTEGGYVCFQIPFELSQMPDSFLIGLGSSDADNIFSEAEPGIGSTLWVDILDFKACPTVGIDRTLARTDFRIYPNPTTDYLYLEFSPIPGESYHLRIHDLQGKIVQQKKIPGSLDASYAPYPLEVLSLADGYYLLSLTNEAGDILIAEKFAKQ